MNKYILKKEKKEKVPNLVNLFAPTTVSFADQSEMERMLGLIGVQVNYIPFYSSLEKIKRIPQAVASTSICKVFADEFMKTLEEDYGIPYSHTVMPIGIRNTDKWYRGIAKVLGKEKEVEEIIAREHTRIEPLVAKIRSKLEGKRVFICGGTGRSFAAAALIDDFGMKLVGLETPTYDADAQVDVEYLNGIHKDFVVDIANMQPFEQVNLVKKLKPDAFIGVPEWAAKLGIPTTHVLDGKRPTMGYDGLLYLGNKIADQLSNPGCCMQTTAAEQGNSGHKHACFVSGVSLPSSNMLEKEVVFGGVNKLRTTIAGAIEIIDADAYFVLTGCTAGIIGDDIASVTDEFVAKGHKVYAIDTPGFAGDSLLGYETVWNTFIDKVIQPPRRDGAAGRSKKLVNLFGIVPYHDPYWSGTLEELDRILSRLGLEVNTFFTKHQGMETVEHCSEASLNIIVNPWLFKGPAEKFEKKFGVPSLRFPFVPTGASDTTRFVREVAAALSLDKQLVEQVVHDEEDYVYSYLAQSIGALSWKRFAVAGDASSVIGISRYLSNDYSFSCSSRGRASVGSP